MNNFDESFFKLCEFDTYMSIKHNLRNWNITIEGWINKAGQIETYLNIPYSEMEIEVIENNYDTNFFNKATARIKIRLNKYNKNYLFPEKVKCNFNERIEYVLIDTLFIYPHNLYYIYNREYLSNKIYISIDYLKKFIEGYKEVFNTNIPFLFINKVTETSSDNKLELIIKEYLDIFYIKTDYDSSTIVCNLLVDKNFQKERNIKYKKISLTIPRGIKNRLVKFKFVTGNWIK
jgi:hypothetical protein